MLLTSTLSTKACFHKSDMSKTVVSSRKFSASAIVCSIESAFEKLGYNSICEEQFDSVRVILEGRDVFVSLPTGVESHFATVVFPWCSTSCKLFHKAGQLLLLL